MNRQERRRKGILRKDPMISIKSSDIKAMKDEATAKGCKFAFQLMLVIPSMVIHDKFGSLMKKDGRLERFIDSEHSWGEHCGDFHIEPVHGEWQASVIEFSGGQ